MWNDGHLRWTIGLGRGSGTVEEGTGGALVRAAGVAPTCGGSGALYAALTHARARLTWTGRVALVVRRAVRGLSDTAAPLAARVSWRAQVAGKGPDPWLAHVQGGMDESARAPVGSVARTRATTRATTCRRRPARVAAWRAGCARPRAAGGTCARAARVVCGWAVCSVGDAHVSACLGCVVSWRANG